MLSGLDTLWGYGALPKVQAPKDTPCQMRPKLPAHDVDVGPQRVGDVEFNLTAEVEALLSEQEEPGSGAADLRDWLECQLKASSPPRGTGQETLVGDGSQKTPPPRGRSSRHPPGSRTRVKGYKGKSGWPTSTREDIRPALHQTATPQLNKL